MQEMEKSAAAVKLMMSAARDVSSAPRTRMNPLTVFVSAARSSSDDVRARTVDAHMRRTSSSRDSARWRSASVMGFRNRMLWYVVPWLRLLSAMPANLRTTVSFWRHSVMIVLTTSSVRSMSSCFPGAAAASGTTVMMCANMANADAMMRWSSMPEFVASVVIIASTSVCVCELCRLRSSAMLASAMPQ